MPCGLQPWLRYLCLCHGGLHASLEQRLAVLPSLMSNWRMYAGPRQMPAHRLLPTRVSNLLDAFCLSSVTVHSCTARCDSCLNGVAGFRWNKDNPSEELEPLFLIVTTAFITKKLKDHAKKTPGLVVIDKSSIRFWCPFLAAEMLRLL